jgi:hypothetical protein
LRETQFGPASRALLPFQTSLHGIALRGGTAFTLSFIGHFKKSYSVHIEKIFQFIINLSKKSNI